NNQITATAGGYTAGGDASGNTLVTIDANGAIITGNAFEGTTTRFGYSLRARGTNTVISGNTFHAAGLSDTAGHLFVNETIYAGTALDNIVDVFNANTFIGRATVTSADLDAVSDRIGLTIQGAINASQSGATVYANA